MVKTEYLSYTGKLNHVVSEHQHIATLLALGEAETECQEKHSSSISAPPILSTMCFDMRSCHAEKHRGACIPLHSCGEASDGA